jgi:uncharacterized protein involved in exopolysaccharide biosynthesis
VSSSEPLPIVQDGEIDFLALWHMLWAQRWVIVGTGSVAVAVAAYLALTAIPIYRAEAVVSEVRDNGGGMGALASQFGGLANLAGVNLGSSTGSNRSASAVLQSRRLAERFVVERKLAKTLAQGSGEPASQWRVVRSFRSGVLDIKEDVRKGLITVAVEWRDPKVAADWANGFVELANDDIRARAVEESKRNLAYLNEQIAKSNVLELQRVIYSLIENETKTLMMANGRAEYAFTVIDPAVAPEVRVSPRRVLMVLVGAIIGGFLGCAYAVFRGFTRRSKRAPATAVSHA